MPVLAENVLPALQQLYDSGRRYEFLAQAHRLLAAAPVAPELACLTLRALVELGLGGPALELLQLRRDLGGTAEERAALRASLAALPSGRVPWSELEATFQQNLAALATGRPEWQDAEARLRAVLGPIHLYRSRSGHHLLSRRAPGKVREWLVDLRAPETQSDMSPVAHRKRARAAVLGTRLGPLLPALYRQSQHVELWYSHPLYLLEPDWAVFAAWLHCADHTAWLVDPRVYVFVGPDAVADCARRWAQNPRLVLPGWLMDFTGQERLEDELHTAIRQAVQCDKAEYEQLCARLAERYRTRDAAYWAARFQPPGPILAVTSRFTTMLQYSTRDVLAALAAQGYQTELLIESSDHELLRPADLLRAILDLDPLLVIALDRARHAMAYLPRNLPYLLWIQDPLSELLSRAAGASVGPYDFVCGYYRRRCVDELGYPAERFMPTKVPVSTAVFHDAPLAAETARRYAADLCYVGHGSQPMEALYQKARAKYPPILHPQLAEVYARVQALLDADAERTGFTHLDALLRSVASAGKISFIDLAHRLYDVGRRQQTLAWVAAWAHQTGRRFRIYGRGWEQHPTLAEFAAGPIEHGEPLRCVYRAAPLALQLMPSGYLHQRSFEAVASGALPLTRYVLDDFGGRPLGQYVAQRDSVPAVEAAANIFPGFERVVFRTPAEFATLAETLLADESRRCQILSDFRTVVLREFTYTTVMRDVMSAFREALCRLSC